MAEITGGQPTDVPLCQTRFTATSIIPVSTTTDATGIIGATGLRVIAGSGTT